jgi:hypothetical protein
MLSTAQRKAKARLSQNIEEATIAAANRRVPL